MDKAKAYFRYWQKIIIMQLLKVLWIIPVSTKRILFISFDGSQYSDSPKYICEMFYQKKNNEYEYIWALNDSHKKAAPQWVKKVERKSFAFLFYLVSSKVIITNNSLYSYYPIRKSQVVLNTWHGGSPLKTCGLAEEGSTVYDHLFFKLQAKKYTGYLSSSEFMTKDVFERSLAYHGLILPFGMPRNAILFQEHSDVIEKVYRYFNIERGGDRGIILYAPTYRGSTYSGSSVGVSFLPEEQLLDIKRCIEAFSKRTGKKYSFLFRAHYAMKFDVDEKLCIKASDYPDMQELLCASDILITDYSSCMGDMALMRKPIFLYTPDLDDYIRNRGFYWDIHELPFPLVYDNNHFAEVIEAFDYPKYKDGIEQYLNRLGSYEDEHSIQRTYDWLLSQIE